MTIRILELTEDRVEDVRLFNARLREGGVKSQFPESPSSHWIPKLPGRPVYQDHWVALDGTDAVRGAYIYKYQEFLIDGVRMEIGDWQLPISEGLVDPVHTAVAVDLYFHCLARNKLLYGLGIGGYQEPVAKFMRKGGWRIVTVPFLFRVNRPFRFFRHIRFLRSTHVRKVAFDLAAYTGVVGLAIRLWQALQRLRHRGDGRVDVREVESFGPWAEGLWQAHQGAYRMTAVRDLSTLHALYPAGSKRFRRLQILEGGRTIGWAVVLASRLENHKHFGGMHLGSLVDGFAAPEDSPKVVRAATDFLDALGVDLIVTNQSHKAWMLACQGAGYLTGPSNFLLATSPALTRLLTSAGIPEEGVFMNRGDGDGPIHL